MRKETSLLILSTVFSVAIAAVVLRYLAPQFFRAPVDLTITQSSKELPPFFRGALRHEAGLDGQDLLVNDPETIVRGQSFYPNLQGSGPHDSLGFRNLNVPWRADLVVLGDSQSYGIGVNFEQSWPEKLKELLPTSFRGVYSAALGGFSMAQYDVLSAYLTRLRPTHFLVAIYTGNDLLETFRAVYSLPRFAALRDSRFSLDDLPPVIFPPPSDTYEKITFANGYETIFTPKSRYDALSSSQPAAREGLRLTEKLLERVASTVEGANAKLVVTLIPTKEFLHYRRAESEGLELSEVFESLFKDEGALIDSIESRSKALGLPYIDLAAPLSEAVSKGASLYKSNDDGHPAPAGYSLISQVIAHHLQPEAIDLADGYYRVQDGGVELFVEKKSESFRLLKNRNALASLGVDPEQVQSISPNLFYRYPLRADAS